MRVRRHMLVVGVVALLTSVVATPVALARTAGAAPTTTGITTPVTGTTANGGTFSGTLAVTKFVQRNGTLAAVGTLSGTITDAVGNVTPVSNVPVTLPVTATATCQVLHLELGPLDLNLLGLMVHLDRVVLDITAQSGPGNLLGNLLCGLAGLLDNGGGLAGIVTLLNQLLGHL